jgi:hypothetical protein
MCAARLVPDNGPSALVAAHRWMRARGLAQHRMTIRNVPAMDRVVLPLHRLRNRHGAQAGLMDDVYHIDMAVVPVKVAEE